MSHKNNGKKKIFNKINEILLELKHIKNLEKRFIEKL